MDGPPALLKGEKKEKEKRRSFTSIQMVHTHMTHDLVLKDNYIYIYVWSSPSEVLEATQVKLEVE